MKYIDLRMPIVMPDEEYEDYPGQYIDGPDERHEAESESEEQEESC